MNNIDIRNTVRQDVQRSLASRWTQIAGRFASALTGQRIACNLSADRIAPAWSNESAIWFSESQLPDLATDRGAVVVKALTWHELGHILFTPRNGSVWSDAVKSQGLWSFANILEDARLENLLVARYSSDTSDWLTALIGNYLLTDTTDLTQAFPLIGGRKYLPADVRQSVRQAYAHQSIVADLQAVMDEYILLTFPTDTDRGVELVAEFARLLKSVQADLPQSDPTHGEDKTPAEYEADPDHKPLTEQQVKDLRDKVKDSLDEDEDESATNNQPADADAEQDEDEQDGAGAGAGETEDEDGEPVDGDAQSTAGESDTQSDTEASDTESDSDSTEDANGAGDGETEADIDSALDSIKDSLAKAMESLAGALDNVRKQLDSDHDLETVGRALPAKARHEVESVAPETMTGAVTFSRELERLKADHDPAWERGVASGRVNVQRVIQGCDPEQAFDRWDEGKADVTAIEAVIALDISGSMQNIVADAYRAMYQIKSALDLIPEANCTVLVYNGRTQLLYGADETAGNKVRNAGCGGGTYVTPAVETANDILAKSDKPVKLFFTITDGLWDDSDVKSLEPHVERMRQAGVVTTLAWLGGYQPQTAPNYGYEVVTACDSTAQLLQLGRKVVNYAVDRNLVKA